MDEFELGEKLGYTSSFGQDNFSFDTTENWQRILENCQPHEVFETTWSSYDPISFGDTFLPNVQKYRGKGILFYDGLGLMEGGYKALESQLLFTDSNRPINIVAFSIPKGSIASEKKNSIQPRHDQLVIMMEMDENEDVIVSFKFGQNFQKYLESNELSPTILERNQYRDEFDNLQAYFNKNMSHKVVSNFALSTLGVDTSSAYGNTNKGRLEAFLKENGMQSFIYKNVCEDGKEVAVQGTLVDDHLQLNYIDASTIESITSVTLGETKEAILFQYEVLANGDQNAWRLSELAIPDAFKGGTCSDTDDTPMNEEEIDHVTETVTEHINHTKRTGALKQYHELSNSIRKQLDNPFYEEVDLCVNLTVFEGNNVPSTNQAKNTLDGNQSGILAGVFNTTQNSKQEPEKKKEEYLNKYEFSYNKSNKPCGITLNIEINAQGEVSIDQTVSPDYLKEYENKWKKEIKERGLEDEIDIQEIREQVRADLENKTLQKNFVEKFIQNAKAFFNENIVGFIEGVQATQKVVVHVFSEGKMPEGIWHSTGEDKEDYENFPTYMHLNPTVAGGIDGVIDEIASIPMAIKGLYGVITDEQQREALKKMFTKEGLSQLLEGLKQEYEQIKEDPEYREYIGGKTVIGVATMFFGVGFVTKGGKLGKVISTASNRAVKAVSSKVMKTIQELKDWFKKRPKARKDIDDLKADVGPEIINEIATEASIDPDFKKQVKRNTKKMADGKRFEKNIEKLVDAGDEKFLRKIADEAGIPLDELSDYIPLKQVQIRLPDVGFTVADNVWIKKIDDGFGGFDYDVILNECKLSKSTNFTTRQKQFIKKIGEPDVEFKLRSKKFIEEGFDQDINLNIKSYIITSGSGAADKLDDVLIEKIK